MSAWQNELSRTLRFRAPTKAYLNWLTNAYLPVVLSEPIVQTLSHVECFERHYELFLQFNVLVDGGHTLLPIAAPEVMNILQIFITFFLRRNF